MFYNENNCPTLPCPALPCFELALLEDNGQEDNGLPYPAPFRIGVARR